MVWATEGFVQRELSGASCQVLYVRPDLSAAAGGLDSEAIDDRST